MINVPTAIASGKGRAVISKKPINGMNPYCETTPIARPFGRLSARTKSRGVSDAPMPNIITAIIRARMACSKGPTMTLSLAQFFGAQVFAQDFSDVGFGQIIPEFNDFGHLVVGQVLFAVSA